MTLAVRGSRISRTIHYFMEAEIEEAKVVWMRVNEIMSERTKLSTPKPVRRRTRSAKTMAARVGSAGIGSGLTTHESQQEAS